MSVSKKSIARIFLSIFVMHFAVQEASAEDPGAIGPFPVSESEYDLGDSAFSSAQSGFPGPIELRAHVHYPTSLLNGHLPLVVFMHGRHATCYDATESYFQWPCSAGRLPIPNYRGYDYIAKALASHGYIVVSISANGINALDGNVEDNGLDARARLIQRHLDMWNTFNSVGGTPFGNMFVGKVNMRNIGTMGHSRGGEGVVAHYNYNLSLGSPYQIRAVFPLAPMNDYRKIVSKAALGVLLPYCDGDVIDLQGVHYFDDVRYVSGNSESAHVFLVMGANHNFYNTEWTPGLSHDPKADDDWPEYTFRAGGTIPFPAASDPECGRDSSHRLTITQQQGTAVGLISGFFRTYLGQEKQFRNILNGNSPLPLQAANIFTSYNPSAGNRLDVNRLDSKDRELTNTLGSQVSSSGLAVNNICGSTSDTSLCLTALVDKIRQPHNVPSRKNNRLGLSQLLLRWDGNGAWYENQIPQGKRNISIFDKLQFRGGVNFSDSPVGQAQDFTIELRDANDRVSSVRVSQFSQALFYPPGDPLLMWDFMGGGLNQIPRLFLNTIRIPLSAFSGVNLSNIAAVRFKFDRTAQGSISISDLALVKDERVNISPVLEMLKE